MLAVLNYESYLVVNDLGMKLIRRIIAIFALRAIVASPSAIANYKKIYKETKAWNFSFRSLFGAVKPIVAALFIKSKV